MKSRLLFAGGVLAASLAIASPGQAQAQSVSGAMGPVPVPNVPVQLCVGSTCQQTPVLSSVGLLVSALVDANAVPPTMQTGPCAVGNGGVMVVRGGSAGEIVTGTLNGTRPDGSQYEQAIGPPILLASNATMTISACTEAGGTAPAPIGSALAPIRSGLGLLPGGLAL